MRSPLAALLLGMVLLSSSVSAGEDDLDEEGCAPYRWDDGKPVPSDRPPWPTATPSVPRHKPGGFQPGDLVCRSWTWGEERVDRGSCAKLAEMYDLTLERFFFLNPELDEACETVRPNTEYCIAGCKCPRPALLEKREF